MTTLRTRAGKGGVFIVVLVSSALAGCGTSSHQTPVANVRVAAQQSVQSSAPQAPARSSRTHASSAPAAPNKETTGSVLSQIHQTNLMEIALCKMAEEKAWRIEVRAYAEELVQDHTNIDETVVAMAQKSGADLQNGAAAHREGRPEITHVKQLERKLKSASGPEFDRLFLQQTSSDHERLIRNLQQDREDASNEELEALIDKMIPILEQHRELAEILMKKASA
jgi:putative membrane protein